MLIDHFMFGPSYADGCPVNSSIADAFDSLIPHLKARDVSLPRPISDFTIRRIQHALGNHGPELPGDDRAPTVADVTSRPSGASPSRSYKKRGRNCATYRVR